MQERSTQRSSTWTFAGQGRSFHRNRMQAEAQGVHLVRSRLEDIVPAADGGVRVCYIDSESGLTKRERFDLLVLSTGQTPSPQAAELGKMLGWESTEAGYAPSKELDPTRSPAPGVFLAGSVTGPTDIAESIISATAASGEVSRLLFSLGRDVGAKRTLPPPQAANGRRVPRTWTRLPLPSSLSAVSKRP